jgi:OmpA-OmpF porin, OOP family
MVTAAGRASRQNRIVPAAGELTMKLHRLSVSAALLLGAGLAFAAAGDQAVPPLPAAAAAAPTATKTQTTSIPAKGLFQGDKLTETARQKLAELIINAIGLQVDVALLVPTGPWKIEDTGSDERSLTPARLAAVKKFLTERGVEPKRIFVESRVDEKIKEPRLDVQIVGKPAND